MEIIGNVENIIPDYRKEIHPIYDMLLDTFENIKSPKVSGEKKLWDVLQKIKYNLCSDITPDIYLTSKYSGDQRNPKYDNIKQELPTVSYNARFNGYKSLASLSQINNIMFLDIDGFNSKEETLNFKSEIVQKYDWILACSLSLSKLGLHVIIKVDRIIDNNDFNKKYDFISKTYFDGKLDNNSKSLTRFTVIPYDYNIYINESPKTLDINSIINKKEKGIRSVSNEDIVVNDNNEKGIRSVKEKKKIISTAYTFSPSTSLKETMDYAARKNSLKFREEVDEELFTDPDIPLYYHEGVDVIEIKLYQYRDNKVNAGGRNKFIGAISAQLIYLNIYLPNNNDPIIRDGIIKAMAGINNKTCNPPLTYKEVLDSVTSNFKQYDEGKLDCSRYYRKKRAFWSKRTTLKGNEKRKVTSKFKNEPIVQESKRKIKEAIDTINDMGVKLTQKKVADISGLGLGTVKKYRKYYKEINQSTKTNAGKECTDSRITSIKPDQQVTIKQLNLNQDVDLSELGNIDITKCESDIKPVLDIHKEISVPTDVSSIDVGTKPNWSENEIREVFKTIFPIILKKLNEIQEKKLFSEFTKHFNNLSNDEKELLMTPYDNVGEKFFKKGSLHDKIFNLCVGVLQLIQENKERTA